MQYNKLSSLAIRLQYHSELFRTFWDWSDINFTDSIPTACVEFDSSLGTPIQISINPSFWDSLDAESQAFVIAHELMHILLNHGVRYKPDKYDIRKVNIAEDIVIDHMLEDYLSFNRQILHPFLQNQICWIDTVFPNRSDILKDQTVNYYYDKLPTDYNGISEFDIHKFSETAEAVEEFLKATGIKDMAEMDDIISNVLSQAAGTGKGGAIQLQKKHVKPKQKWESVVKEWEAMATKFTIKHVERWDRYNRRFQDVLSSMSDVKLPTTVDMLDDYIEKNRLDVFFFLDVSGSCYSYKDRFYAAAKSLDPKRFNLRLFSFDTQVTALDIDKWKVYGGGGTRFDIIEQKVQEVIKKDGLKKYPHVWNLSDGYGNSVHPEKPERWNWFMTKGFSKQYVHPKSKIYKLEDFE